MIEEELISNRNKNGLPYKPIVFILTQTIGIEGMKENSSASNVKISKDKKFKDILIPKVLRNPLMHYLYYLFHIAPVYNWLRDMRVFGNLKNTEVVEKDPSFGCFEQQVLESYIKGKLSKFQISNNKIGQNYDLRQVERKIFECCSKFEIMKECLMTKIYVKRSCKVERREQSQNEGKQFCKHNIKLSLYTQYYTYDKTNNKLQVKKYYCKQCQKNVLTDQNSYEVQQNPIAPIFDSYFGSEILIKQKGMQTVLRITLIYTANKVLVKSANGLWYCYEFLGKKAQEYGQRKTTYESEMKMVNLDSVLANRHKTGDKSDVGLYIYSREEISKDCGVLKLAESMLKKREEKVGIKIEKSIENKINAQQHGQPLHKQRQKILEPEGQRRNREKTLNKDRRTEEQLEQIPEERFQDKIKIIIPNNISQQAAEKYLQATKSQYIQPKQKDEYEKDYDKGKTKKIKKKIQYPLPNFNQTFHQIKTYNRELNEGKRQPEKRRSKKGSVLLQTEGYGKNQQNTRQSQAKKGGRFVSKQLKKKKKQVFAKKFQES